MDFDLRVLQLTDRLDPLRDSLRSPLVTAAMKRKGPKQIKSTIQDLERALEIREAERNRIAALISRDNGTLSTARQDAAAEHDKKL
jgi:hypothetical protein